VIPFPRPDTTPPVTITYLATWFPPRSENDPTESVLYHYGRVNTTAGEVADGKCQGLG